MSYNKPNDAIVIGYGSKVRYYPPHGGPEKKGIIKEVSGVIAFVVFHCNDEWDKFEDYTGQATNITDLKIGWE